MVVGNDHMSWGGQRTKCDADESSLQKYTVNQCFCCLVFHQQTKITYLLYYIKDDLIVVIHICKYTIQINLPFLFLVNASPENFFGQVREAGDMFNFGTIRPA